MSRGEPFCVPTLGIKSGDCPEWLLGGGNGNQVYVVGHQAVGPDFQAALPAPLAHEFDIGGVVVLAEERPLAAVAPLSDMVRWPGAMTRANRGMSVPCP
jgi:hypothetical protein